MKLNDLGLDLFSLEGKTALVTGASRGLGQAISIGLASVGANIVCSSSQEGGTAETRTKIQEFGCRSWEIPSKLNDTESVLTLAEKARDTTGNIDVLVNAGGTIYREPAVNHSLAEWKNVIDINLTAMFLLSQEVGRSMIQQGSGKIINIASMLSYTGGITVPSYTASKHGVVGLTRALANEWAANEIQVNAIAPGYFKTDNTQALQDDSERNAEIVKRIPASKWGEPNQLIGAAIFLSSQASDYVNGHVLAVDGGWLSR
jgi:2-deoxy-D-gluconate 3-dehydrogenase